MRMPGSDRRRSKRKYVRACTHRKQRSGCAAGVGTTSPQTKYVLTHIKSWLKPSHALKRYGLVHPLAVRGTRRPAKHSRALEVVHCLVVLRLNATQGCHMTRGLEIDSRLNDIAELRALMLKHPRTHHAKMIIERVTALVEYVDHVNAVMWIPQELCQLSGFAARITLPAVFEIWLQVKQELTVNSRPLPE